jgi:hypothetical protein
MIFDDEADGKLQPIVRQAVINFGFMSAGSTK